MVLFGRKWGVVFHLLEGSMFTYVTWNSTQEICLLSNFYAFLPPFLCWVFLGFRSSRTLLVFLGTYKYFTSITKMHEITKALNWRVGKKANNYFYFFLLAIHFCERLRKYQDKSTSLVPLPRADHHSHSVYYF